MEPIEQISRQAAAEMDADELDNYKDWVRKALLNRTEDVRQLSEFADKFSLSSHEEASAQFLDIDTTPIAMFRAGIKSRINNALVDTVEELNCVVFEPSLFRVTITVNGQKLTVESLMVSGGTIVPIVEGEPLQVPITTVEVEKA